MKKATETPYPQVYEELKVLWGAENYKKIYLRAVAEWGDDPTISQLQSMAIGMLLSRRARNGLSFSNPF